MTTTIEPFEAFASIGCGVPLLRTWLNRKTMSVSWGDGSLFDFPEFSAALHSERMNAALLRVWDQHKVQCDRRAAFGRGRVHGTMTFVPIEAGMQASAIVREYFNDALKAMQKGSRQLPSPLESDTFTRASSRLVSR
jgi:hypothetical protein